MLSSMSPLDSVTAKSAHFLIVQGDKDVVVPRAQSIGFQTVLHQNGVPVVFVAYPGGHEFTGLDFRSIWALNGTVVDWMATQLAPSSQ